MLRIWCCCFFIWLCCLASKPGPPFEEHPELFPEILKNTMTIVDSFQSQPMTPTCTEDMGKMIVDMLKIG